MRRSILAVLALIVGVSVVAIAGAVVPARNLDVVAYTANSVTVKWTASPSATGYRLYKDGAAVSTAGKAAVQAKFGQLTFGSHTFGVEALPDGGISTITVKGAWTETGSTEPTPPPPPPPPPSGTNLWVDTNGGSCARTTAYSDAQACSSLAAAYTAAQSGDTITVKAGTYPSQFFAGGFNGSQAAGTKTLLIKGETGNAIRQIHFGSPNLTFDGINVDAKNAILGGSDGALFENGGLPFVFKNGSVGNVRDQKGALVDGPGIVFDNVNFHDVVIATDGVHSECIFAAVPDGMIVRNSTFSNCAVMDIFFVYPDYWSPLPPAYKNVTLENNTFGHPDGTYALYITKIGTTIQNSAPVTGWTIRNNAINGPVNSDAPFGTGNVFCGNTGTELPTGWGSSCSATPPPPSGSTVAPGQSWQTAYNAAPAGSTITVLSGNHGAPALTGTKAVTFLGQNGAVVSTMPGDAANVTFQNIDINTGTEMYYRSASYPSAQNITWRNVDVSGDHPSIEVNADHFSWIGGTLTGPLARTCAAGEALTINSDFVLIDGVTWGPGKAGICPGGDNFHLEDLRVQGANDLTLRNLTFAANSDAGSGHIFITTTSPSDSQARRLTLENSVLPPVIGSYAIQAHTNIQSYDHYVFKNNRFDQPLLMDSPFVAPITCGNTGSVPTSWKGAC